jgi:hypothetical protein
MKALAELTFAAPAGHGTPSSHAGGDRMSPAAGLRLAVAHRIEARVDEAVPFPIAVEGIEALGGGSVLVVRGLPADAALSHGEPLEPGTWRVDARSAANLTLTVSRRIDGPQAISVELLAPEEEVVAAAAATTLTIALADSGR